MVTFLLQIQLRENQSNCLTFLLGQLGIYEIDFCVIYERIFFSEITPLYLYTVFGSKVTTNRFIFEFDFHSLFFHYTGASYM